MGTIKNNNELPHLTKEEFAFFKKQEVDFYERYSLQGIRPLYRRVASALHSLAVAKLCGVYGFEKNKSEAIEHHLKACKYDRSKAYLQTFRKQTGLLIYKESGLFK